MPDQRWVDDVLGNGQPIDPAFRSRLEATLVDEWHDVQLIDLVAGDERASAGPRRREPRPRRNSVLVPVLAGVAAIVLIVAAVSVLGSDDDETPATNPTTATFPTPSTLDPDRIVVPSTGGRYLDIRTVAELAGGFAVTSYNGRFDVLVRTRVGFGVRRVDVDGRVGAATPIETPGRRFRPVGLHRSAGGSLYAEWFGPDGITTVASYEVDLTGSYVIADRAFIDGAITVDERGLSTGDRVVLEPPVREEPVMPNVSVERDIFSGETSVVWRSLDGAERSWELNLRPPENGQAPFVEVLSRPDGAVLVESDAQRTNVVSLGLDGRAIIVYFVSRLWTVVGASKYRILLWQPTMGGLQLATAELRD